MKFTKMHGIGNDFVVVDCLAGEPDGESPGELSRRLNDRKFGVGGDGLVLVLPSDEADFRMRMFNPDGSEAEMCGNGIRCFAKYLFDHGLHASLDMRVETLAGLMQVELDAPSGQVTSVRVDMGVPQTDRRQIPMAGSQGGPVIDEALVADGRTFAVTAVSMGNPHAVIFCQDTSEIDIERFGPAIERHESFPERTNVHFVAVQSAAEAVVRTWERGAGLTLACGTGACAVAVAGNLSGRTGRSLLAHLPGGDLRIDWQENGHVMMTGPACEVFTGEIPERSGSAVMEQRR